LVHKKATPSQKAAIRRYLATGDHQPNIHLWPGQNFLESEINTHTALRGALIDAFKERTAEVSKLPSVRTGDVSSLTRTKVAPMVGGLFAKSEQAAVMSALEPQRGRFPAGKPQAPQCRAPDPVVRALAKCQSAR
jgi:hypothetical protein